MNPSQNPLPGTARWAFFDVDETVVRFKSMFSFSEFWHRHVGPFAGLAGGWRHRRFLAYMKRQLELGRPREFINAAYYRGFAGRRPEVVGALVGRWFEAVARMPGGIYIPRTLEIIREHQRAGTRIAFVSGSFMELLKPIADDVGADRVLATRLEVAGGRYTGNIVPPQMIGAGKAAAVRGMLEREGIDPARAWAYGDHISDLAMLEQVGHPYIVSNDPQMVAISAERGWGLVNPEAAPAKEPICETV